MTETRSQHLLTVHKGNPDEAELAALTAVLIGCAAAAVEQPNTQDRGRAVASWTSGGPAHEGPRSWRRPT